LALLNPIENKPTTSELTRIAQQRNAYSQEQSY